jgi:hypothetical protein
LSAVHFHLILNHVPTIGMIGAVLLLIWAMFRRHPELLRTALGAVVLVGLITIPAFLTGEPSEEIVEHMAGVDHDRIEEHEEAGKWVLINTEVAAAVALLSLILSRRGAVPKWSAPAVLILSLFAFVTAARTAYLGGEIRHPEIRGEQTAAEHVEEAEDESGRGRGRGGR